MGCEGLVETCTTKERERATVTSEVTAARVSEQRALCVTKAFAAHFMLIG